MLWKLRQALAFVGNSFELDLCHGLSSVPEFSHALPLRFLASAGASEERGLMLLVENLNAGTRDKEVNRCRLTRFSGTLTPCPGGFADIRNHHPVSSGTLARGF